ncbi:MAG TPA: class I tRNA ligase family protein, partial [Nitrososphaerales archaeon]|nr:class I tRNA ligase family protein [Nitrososphaerales archaeon]
IYMAFYTIRPLLVSNNISPKSLTDEFFDYVLLGIGDLTTVSDKVSLAPQLLGELRRDFLYWYPVDLRNSAKELIPNHLMFFVFQHVAFFPKSLWPKGISANGMMMAEGEKMSKSKGNVITLSSALDRLGADVVRSALMDGAEGLDDMDWREKNAKDIEGKIQGLSNFVSNLISSTSNESGKTKDLTSVDMWLENQIQKRIRSVSANLDAMKTKSGFQEAFYSYWNDLRYYNSRVEELNPGVVLYAIDVWLKLLAPFLPYSVEEINETLGNKEMICSSKFPIEERSKVHPAAELAETLISKLVDDSNNILNLIPQKPQKLFIYVAPAWAYRLFYRLVQTRKSGEKTSETLRKFFQEYPELEKKTVSAAMTRISKSINELGEDFLENYQAAEGFEERVVYEESARYLKNRLNVVAAVSGGGEEVSYDPKNKAVFALPFKPALYFE